MDNYKKQILQRVIDFYIEKADADKKTIKTVACLMNDIEAINYTHCCTELKSKKELTFDDWCEKYVSVQGENIYLYKKTSYSLFELMMVYMKIKEMNL